MSKYKTNLSSGSKEEAIKEIEEYQKKCTEEISQVSYGRGGREIGEFENPIKIERRELNES